MTETGQSDMDKIILTLLKEKGRANLRTLASHIGNLKEYFENNPGDIPTGLEGLTTCVDDVPRSLKKLMGKDLILREGKNPREWVYLLTQEGESKEILSKDSSLAVSKLVERLG